MNLFVDFFLMLVLLLLSLVQLVQLGKWVLSQLSEAEVLGKDEEVADRGAFSRLLMVV